MDIVFLGLTATAEDYGEYDKLIKIITAQGIKRCVIKGVKKPSAKLRAAAMPFAFYEFTASKRNKDALPVIIGASQVEDLFNIVKDTDKHLAASLMAEAALFCFFDPCDEFFVYILRRLKDVIYSPVSPYLPAIRFFQYIIHSSGYNYDYPQFAGGGEPSTPVELLSLLNSVPSSEAAAFSVNQGLISATLKKIIANFESKFECLLNSKKLL